MINNDAVCYLASARRTLMLHISYRRFCSVQCTAHRERERYLGWYGTAQEYSGVRQAWPRQRLQSDCYTYSRERLWCLEDPRRLQNDAAPDPDHRTSTGERAASFRAQARASPAGTPRVSDSRLQPHRPVAQSHKTRRRTTAHTTRAHRGSSVRCLHAQATSPSLRRSARASSKSLARY